MKKENWLKRICFKERVEKTAVSSRYTELLSVIFYIFCLGKCYFYQGKVRPGNFETICLGQRGLTVYAYTLFNDIFLFYFSRL